MAETNFKNIVLICEKIKIMPKCNAKFFCDVIQEEVIAYLRDHTAKEFYENLLKVESSAYINKDEGELENLRMEIQTAIFENFCICVLNLKSTFDTLTNIFNNLPEAFRTSRFNNAYVQDLFRTALLAQTNTEFLKTVYIVFHLYLNIFTRRMGGGYSEMVEPEICNWCQEERACNCDAIEKRVEEINRNLIAMGLLDRMAGQAITTLVQKRVKVHIKETCYGVFDRSHLRDLEEWMESTVIVWLEHIFDTRDTFKVKLTYFLYEHFARSIIDQFFSIIIDFPDSLPAIDDLKICMEKIDLRKYLVKTLKDSLQARILHPGVNTMDILTGYVAAIKAIRHIDPSGVILETVTAPIRDYLRKRSDTVRRVVTGLTEEGPTDLSEELAKGEALKENINSLGDDELNNWENWQPDPFGFDNNNTSQNQSRTILTANSSKTADIISMIVDIYGSKELFMNEYRNLMADRLLSQLDFNPEKEIRNLELLKIRFGESLLHTCEVMLKDVSDSKRINSHIQEDSKYTDRKFDVSCLIISAQFWPVFNKETLKLPDEIANELEKFTKSYESYKGNRTLNWRTVTGRVNIVIEIGNRTLDMMVAPTQAVIIYHFQEKNEWSLDDLSFITKVTPSVLRRRIGFWLSNGILNEVRPGIFRLNEEEVGSTKSNVSNDSKNAHQMVMVEEDDEESAMATASDQREEELQIFWSYIVGMLTNLDSLSLERIHQMLKLFALNGVNQEFTQDELKEFLQNKVREQKLVFSGGVYQLEKEK